MGSGTMDSDCSTLWIALHNATWNELGRHTAIQVVGKGFDEADKGSMFFRQGTKNQWKNKLNISHIKMIEKEFKEEMEFLGYL